MKDTTTGTIAKCTTLKYVATLKKGSGLSGSGIGSLTSIIHGGCVVGPLSFTVAAESLPYKLNATSYNASTGVTTGSITGIVLVVTGSGCSLTLEGPTAGSTGKLKITYTNSTGVLKLLSTGGTMHAQNVNGCLGLTNNGDSLAFSASTKVSPQQTITSP